MYGGYTLVVCEKPDAAKRVAYALSAGDCRSELMDGVTVYTFHRGGEGYVVCAAQGHAYGVSDPADERTVYPVFDTEWYPSDLIDDDSKGAVRRISVIRKLAHGASKLVNACDFDVEGETIGFNLLRYACGGREGEALRARFSTLTEEDLVKAFNDLRPQKSEGLARAGRARHAIDFVWGVNLSRALSRSAMSTGGRYRTVSVGRVQGPTLNFLVQREREIREFVPVPYWRVSGVFEKDGRRFTASYSGAEVRTKALAGQIREACMGREASVEVVQRSTVQVGPPPPFNTGDLQREAYSQFGLAPNRTLQAAERLYLDALISYPRTGSQKLPPSIDYKGILRGLGWVSEYSVHVAELMKSEPKPVQGAKVDPAHPAIHPTGEKPRRALGTAEASVFDLVVRRFLATFGPTARREAAEVRLAVGEYHFKLAGARTVLSGWMKYYGKYVRHRDVEIPRIAVGDRVRVVGIGVEEKFEQSPPRYNQSSLLEKMEREAIGTKATRADIIATLIERGYVSGQSMEVTDLGLAVAEALAKYSPSILDTQLTRDIEEKLDAVESGTRGGHELLRETVRSIARQMTSLTANEGAVGHEIGTALAGAMTRAVVLGRCPSCRTGDLRIVRSKATRKRFVGCSNYSSGCRASAPLPQRGTVKVTGKACERCSWPIVYIVGAGRPWRLCVNPACPGTKS